MWNIFRHLIQNTTAKLPPSLLNSTQLQFNQPHLKFIQKSLSTTPCTLSSIFSTHGSTTTNNPALLGNNHAPQTYPTCSSPSPMFGGLMIVPSRGMKIKGRVKRRCKDCYLIWIEGVLNNRCKTHPRHTQMQKPKYWANTRLLTHASMSPKRPW